MSRVRRVVVDPQKPESIVEQITEILEVLDGFIDFGTPLDPLDHTSGTLAGSSNAAHPGTTQNINGRFVEVELDTSNNPLDTAVTCWHNMTLPVLSASTPNVRWLVVGIQHDGGQGTWWDDIRSPGNVGKGGTNPPTFTAQGAAPFDTLALHWFQNVNDEQIYFQVQIPHAWKIGTTIYPHVHWTPEVSAGGANLCVSWGLEYSWGNEGEAFPAATTIYTDATDDSTQTRQAEQLVAGRQYVSLFNSGNGISASGRLLSSMITCRLFRDTQDVGPGTDDYPDEAGLLELDFHMEMESAGSDQQFVKVAGLALEAQTISVRYDPTDTVATDSIQLRFHAHPSLLIDDSNKATVTLFVFPTAQ